MRFDPEEEVEAEEGGHHDDVAGDAQHVADLVSDQEELVDKSEKEKKQFFVELLSGQH